MSIKTLHRFTSGNSKVRLVQRDGTKPFAVILDFDENQASFEPYADFPAATAAYHSLVARMKSHETTSSFRSQAEQTPSKGDQADAHTSVR